MEEPTILKRNSRKATRFGLMVAGQAGLGKTSFLATVFDQIRPLYEEVGGGAADPIPQRIFTPTTEITTYRVEVEPQGGGTRLLVDIIDTPGFDDDLSPQEQAELVLQHLEGSFDDVFGEEQRVRRNPKFEDRRVHALLYFIEPTSLGLKRFDAEFIKHIGTRVNVIPVLAKADGFAEAEEARQTQLMIMAEIEKAQIPIYDFSQAEDGPVALRARQPFLISGAIQRADGSRQERPGCHRIPSDVALLKAILLEYVASDGATANDDYHDALSSHARDDLKEHTEDALYEEYRTEKLLALGPQSPA